MNFKNIESYLKQNYKFVIIICLFLFLIQNNQEDFTTTQALDAVKLTETKVNNMVINAGADHIDLKSKIRLSKKWSGYPDKAADQSEISNDTGSYKTLMIVGNKSSGTRKVSIWDHLDVHGNQLTSGYIKSNSKLCIKGTCIDENDLKKMKSSRMLGGYAIDGGGSTFMFEEGGWYNLVGGAKYDAWSNDAWDMAYLYRGWKLELARDANGGGGKQTWDNKTEDVKKLDTHNNWGSSYKLTWVGY